MQKDADDTLPGDDAIVTMTGWDFKVMFRYIQARVAKVDLLERRIEFLENEMKKMAAERPKPQSDARC